MSSDFDAGALRALAENIARVIQGKDEVIERLVVALLAGGHVLLEDVPGVGKTMLARALARSLNADYARIQCTPDLLPGDVTGVSIYDPGTQRFEFRRGPVFTHLLLVDEVNRATPRTQSALLEAMEEGQVSAEGRSHALPKPFFLIATQNPVEMAGTFPLPEAQRDRFLMRLSVGYPADGVEVRVLAALRAGHPIDALDAVMDLPALIAAQSAVHAVHVDASLLRYIQRIVSATRRHERTAYGASPRGGIALMRASQALALVQGRDYITPDDVQTLAPSVLEHRLLLDPRARVEGVSAAAVLSEVLASIAVPVDYEGPGA